VMYGGQIVEQAPVRELFSNPQHPYTRALLETLPSVTGLRSEKLRTIEGQPPSLSAHPVSCPFKARCSHALDICGRKNPPILKLTGDHDVACFWDAKTGAERHA